MLHSGNLDMSFSGLKTAVMTTAMKLSANTQAQERFTLSPQDQADLAASFQAAVVDVLAYKAKQAMRKQQDWFKNYRAKPKLVVAGGVGANQALRQTLLHTGQTERFEVFFPEPQWCTDNGAMIALAGTLHIQTQGLPAQPMLNMSTRSRWPLSTCC
jgi:N6-L-threonylcarbamoyladenine synthase